MVIAPINHISLNEKGVACISGTRIKVRHIAVESSVWKKSPESIQTDYPYLSLGQIYAALAYYSDHQEAIEAEIAAEEAYVERLRSQQSSPLTRQALMERLERQKSGDI